MKLNIVVDRLLGIFSRDINTDELLRRRFRKLYDIDVGMHSFWRFNSDQVSWGTRIGRYCSIPGSARIIDENHPVHALSTHPLFYLEDSELTGGHHPRPEPTIIEDDVWMGYASILTPGCKRVGRGAVIGAGAVVMRDVPPYAIMMGVPAQLVRFRFSPGLIAAIEATRWWELDPAELRAATRDNPGFLTAPTVETAREFLRHRGFIDTMVPERTAACDGLALDEALLLAAFGREVPGFTADMLDEPVSELGIDSFGLISLRLTLEQQSSRRISDTDWGSMTVPRDLLRSARPEKTLSDALPSVPVATSGDGVVELVDDNAERRRFTLTLPRMAMSGLSESWVLKEALAIHWSNIARGIGTATHQIVDDRGRGLYATVTRCQFEASVPLSAFSENEAFAVELATTRMGGALFFGDGQLSGESGSIQFSLMTSFAKFGEAGANTSLLKGQPVVAADCAIPILTTTPRFVNDYRAIRSQDEPAPLFTVEYDIQPPHDINGIGLLYFAAYPIIVDLCASKYADPRWLTAYATIRRDISYFANADPGETLVFRLLKWEETNDALDFEASLSRKSDGARMAHVTTRKQRVAAVGNAR